METIDVVKAKALEKLDSLVKSGIKYIEDNDMSIKNFNLGCIPDSLFSEEERKEVNNSVKQIEDGEIEFYCKCRGIDIPDKLKK